MKTTPFRDIPNRVLSLLKNKAIWEGLGELRVRGPSYMWYLYTSRKLIYDLLDIYSTFFKSFTTLWVSLFVIFFSNKYPTYLVVTITATKTFHVHSEKDGGQRWNLIHRPVKRMGRLFSPLPILDSVRDNGRYVQLTTLMTDMLIYVYFDDNRRWKFDEIEKMTQGKV